MRYSTEELHYEQITICGYEALFTNERISRDTVPVGWYLYEVRHDDECQGIPCEIARGILVNFWGSLLMRDKLSEIEKEGYLYISEEDWIDDSAGYYLLSEYLEKGDSEHM